MSRSRFNPLKVVLASLWLCLLVGTLAIWWRSHLPLTTIPSLLEEWLSAFGLYKAALIYIFIYAVRPLILFPATLLTVASGLLFGPWLGVLFTIIGENASANFAFCLARWFGRTVVTNHETERLRRWDEKIAKNGIVTVLTMRLIMLPFDLVNFGCGLTAVSQRDFFIGTFIGILPALIAFVLLGGVVSAGVENRLFVLSLSLLFLGLGLGIARWLKRRETVCSDAPPQVSQRLL